MTQAVFNSVAITQLQDDLEQTKNEVDKLRAASVRSKDEISLPKRMSLSQLTEIFPKVGDQIDSKLNQELSDARKEYEIKLKKMQDEHNDEVLRIGAVTSEKDSKLQKAEEKLKMVRQRYLYESFDDDLADIQDSHCSSRNNTNDRQDLPPLAQGVNYQAPPAFAFGSSTPLTNPFQKNDLKNPFQSKGFTNSFQKNSLTNPFQNIELANGNVKKRERGKPFQPELGRDIKRVKTEQFDN